MEQTSRTESSVVGREAELDALTRFLDDRAALPRGAVIEGPAGAGKTTLWRAAVERATDLGYLVLSCRPVEAEARLSLGGLSDLLEPRLGSILPGLAPPQRRALEVALLVADEAGRPADQRAVAAGALNATRALAREQPVLLAIDDAQWLDPESAEVIEYVLRRLGDAPVAVLASVRTDSATAVGTGRARGLRLGAALEREPVRVTVGPLSLGAIHRLIRTRTGIEVNRRTLQRIHETSGGNPFYALELARALDESEGSGRASSAVGEPLRLSAGLNELLAHRIGGLGEATRNALFVAAAASQPTLALVEAVIEGSALDALGPAVDAAIVRIEDGAIEFVHPLLAAAAYSLPDAGGRRRWHARLADASADPEARARHLSAARPGQDVEVAHLLHVAGRSARARGAPGIAAELFSEAIDRLPGAAVPRAEWILEAAPLLRQAGDIERAKGLVESALDALPPGPDRSEGLRLLAELVESDAGGSGRTLGLLDQAIAQAGPDARRRAAALLDREMMERSTARLDRALPIARQALEAAEASGDLQLQAEAQVATADLEVLLGLGGDDPVARFARAEELDRHVHVDAENSAPVMLAVCLIRAGRLDEARPRLLDGRRRAMAEGDEASLAQICLFLTELEWLAGNWDDAAGYASEGVEVSEQAGLRLRVGSTTGLAALVEASRGDPDRARATAERAVAICEDLGDIGYGRYARQVLAFLELSLGNPNEVTRSLDTYVVGHAIEGPKRIAFIGDAIEALVRLGEIDRAAALADEVAERGARVRRPPLEAIADRCRALVLAARGDLEAALQSGARSVATFEALGQPFERARSLLVLGEVQRRAKQRRSARETLTEAFAAFARLGARRWAAKAEAERARIGGRTSIEGLSETELAVARLVARGQSNKEVAAELFVSVRAVEANLSKIYAKLGIRSRTELARRI